MTPIFIPRNNDEFSLRSWLEQALATDREDATVRDLARLYATSVIANRAGNKRADNVALVPLVIKDKANEPLSKTHPAMIALSRKYRDNMRRSELSLCFYGRNLLWKRRNYNDTIYSLRWVNPTLWDIDTTIRGSLKGFNIWRNANVEEQPVRYIERQNAVYMHGVDFDEDHEGVAPAEVALRHAQLEVELVETQVWFMRNRAVPFAIVQPTGDAAKKPGKEDRDSLGGLLRRMYQGSRNAGRTLIQSARWEWIQMQGKWNEMAFQEQFNQAYEAVSMAFDMPVSLLRSNFANFAEAETLRRDWAQSWLLPRMEWYGEIYTEDLAQDPAMIKRFGSGLVVVPDTSNVGIFKEDMAAKVNVINVKVSGGYMDLYQAALQSGEKNPPKALVGKYMWNGVPYPVEEIDQLWQSRLPMPVPEFDITVPQLPTTPQTQPPRPLGAGKAVPTDKPNRYAVLAYFDDVLPLIRLQDTLRGILGKAAEEYTIEYIDPKTFHVTLVYVENGQLADVQESLPLNPAAFSVVVDGMNIFQTPEGFAVHLTVRSGDTLVSAQAALYQTITQTGAVVSGYSVPENFRPHITLAYLSFPLGAFDITPFALMVNRIEVSDDNHQTVIVQNLKSKWLADEIHKELTDWQRVVARKGRDYTFEPRAVTDGNTAQFLALALDSDHDLETVFETAQMVLREGLTPEDGWERLEMKSVEAYRRSIRAQVRGLWNGTITRFDFLDGMYSGIRRSFRDAWLTGAAKAGVQPDDLTETELSRLQDEINAEFQFVTGFADAIEEGSKANGGKLAPLLARAEKWLNSFARIFEIARVMALGDKKLRWNYDPSKEHCDDCQVLHNQVRRASFWDRNNLHPKSRSLQCGAGGECGCTFEETDAPVTRGRLPRLVGPRRHIYEPETETT